MAIHNLIALYLFFLFHCVSSSEVATYIVHMDSSAMPTAFSSHLDWYMAVLDTVGGSPARAKLLYCYQNAAHGFTAILSPSEIEALKSLPGYISSYRDFPVKLTTTYSPKFLGLSSDSGAWAISSQGKGVIIGLVDSGIWPESKSFDDHGMGQIPSKWKGTCENGTQFHSSLCNKKLIGARFFNKGLIANRPDLSTSMNSTRDIYGHGTHTASTAAGNFVEHASYFGYGQGPASGMAPLAHVAMYKVWDEDGFASDVIAAIDQAISDGVDVLSLSLGFAGVPLYEDPIAIATFAALEKNIFVVTAAGNSGPRLGSLGNGIPWVLTAAASTMDRQFSAAVTLGNGISVIGASLYPVRSSSSRQFPIVLMRSCTNLTALNNLGIKIVVCQHQGGSLSAPVDTVSMSGVAGGVFVTNDPNVEDFLKISGPAAFVSQENGKIIINYIKTSSSPKASITFPTTILGATPAPRMTTFSGRGPSPSCPVVMKPDLSAPGSLILAAWPKNVPVAHVNSRPFYSDFNVESGTSMSCPHVAGVGALLKATHPTWSPAAIRSAMMTTAESLDDTFGPIQDMGNGNRPASPLAMGSGHLNPNKALDPGLIYDLNSEDYINLLCALNFSAQKIKTVTRSSSPTCAKPSLDINYPSFIAFFKANGSASTQTQEFSRTITNVGDRKSVYKARITGMEGFRISVIPAALVFTEKVHNMTYKLRVEGPSVIKKTVAFGSLSWVDVEGKHVVRSPIVATTLSSVPL